MPARMYYDNDADPAALEGQTVAIIGYGSQGHAHAQNLKDSGVNVIVGLAPGSKSRAIATDAGFEVKDVADAVTDADVRLGRIVAQRLLGQAGRAAKSST